MLTMFFSQQLYIGARGGYRTINVKKNRGCESALRAAISKQSVWPELYWGRLVNDNNLFYVNLKIRLLNLSGSPRRV
jgi:hypothetical protein